MAVVLVGAPEKIGGFLRGGLPSLMVPKRQPALEVPI